MRVAVVDLPVYWRRQICQMNVVVSNIPEASENLREWSHDELVAVAFVVVVFF